MILLSYLLKSSDYSSAMFVVGSYLHSHMVARQNLNIMHAHFAGKMAQNFLPRGRFKTERRSR